jgi:hypothetical protein
LFLRMVISLDLFLKLVEKPSQSRKEETER